MSTEATPTPKLESVASLSRQPLLGQETIFWALTNRTPSRRPVVWGSEWGWPDVVCLPFGSLLSSGAPPRKCGLPSQPPASLSKSHCSWLGRERPNLPPWPWSPLHPLPIQNQFIWVILKAQHLGQLEPVSGRMLGVSSSLKPTCSVCWWGRRNIAKTGNEGLANQASQQLPGFGAGRKPHFLVRWLCPKRQATELYSPALQLCNLGWPRYPVMNQAHTVSSPLTK